MTQNINIYDKYKTPDLIECPQLPVAVELTTEDLFKNDQLIAHSLDDFSFSDVAEMEKVKLGFCVPLLKGLHTTGVSNLSGTALVAGSTVGTYRNNGILLNTAEANIKMASKGDANSNTNADGKLNIGTDNMTIEELTQFIHETSIEQRPSMNEVKGDFTTRSLVGLFLNNIPNKYQQNLLCLKMLLIQKEIKKTYGYEVPLFTYDDKKGSLVQMKNISKPLLYCSLKNGFGKACANIVAQELDGKKFFS